MWNELASGIPKGSLDQEPGPARQPVVGVEDLRRVILELFDYRAGELANESRKDPDRPVGVGARPELE